MWLHAQILPQHHTVELVIILEIVLFLLTLHSVSGLQKPPFGAGFMAAFAIVVTAGLARDHKKSLLS